MSTTGGYPQEGLVSFGPKWTEEGWKTSCFVDVTNRWPLRLF